MRVFPEPAQVSVKGRQDQACGRPTCVKHHDGVLLLGPLKQINLVLSRGGDDFGSPVALNQVCHGLAIELRGVGLADLALVLLDPRLEGGGVEAFLFGNLTRPLRSREESVSIVVLLLIVVFGAVVAAFGPVFILEGGAGRTGVGTWKAGTVGQETNRVNYS